MLNKAVVNYGRIEWMSINIGLRKIREKLSNMLYNGLIQKFMAYNRRKKWNNNPKNKSKNKKI